METSTILGSSHDNSSATIANFQNSLKLNEAIGKTITTLLQNDQFPYKYTQNNQQNTTGSHNVSANPLVSTANSKTIVYLLQLIRILSEICEFYLRHDCIKDAESCCMEICTLHPMSHLAMYLKGRIHQYKAEYRNAKQCFMNALSIDPYHIQSLEQLSIVLFDLGDYSLAEKMLRDAISINNSLPQLWSLLGLVLDAQDDTVSSMECYQTALQLESTNPILPFKSLTRIL
jgi:tetratricopeptide (TPR) repeat protein